MKYVKQTCRLLVVMLVVVACSCASIGFAQNVARGDSFVNDSYTSSSEQADWKDPNHVKTLTRDEFLNQLMTLKHISLSEAAKLDAQTRTAFETNNPQAAAAMTTDSGHYEYLTVYTRQDFGTWLYPGNVELGVLTEVFVDGSFRQFAAVYNAYAALVSSGGYTWTTMYAQASEPDAMTVVLNGRGTLDISVDVSVSGSGTLAHFLGGGFTITGTVGTTYYLRKVCQFSTYRYSLYPNG
jgi:hypothetical protein